MTKSVNAYTDGRNAWKIGLMGRLIDIKGNFLSAILTLITMGAPWWWPSELPEKIELNLKHVIFISIFCIGASLTFALWYLRKRSMRSLETKYCLHQLVHDIRDKQTELHEKLAQQRT